MTSTSKFFVVFVSSLLIFIVCVASINVIINPYLMFAERINMFPIKPEAATRVRMFKKYQAENKGYKTLIVGNSRVEMGIDPNSSLFKNSPAYNVGIPGISFQAQLAYAQNLIDSNPIENVYLAVDFIDFVSFSEATDYSQYNLKKNRFKDITASILSLDALTSSLRTIVNQSQYASTRDENGFNPAYDYVPIIKYEGQNVLTSQKLASLISTFSSAFYDQKLNRSDIQSPLNLLSIKLKQWRNEGINITVFINPFQVSYFDVISEKGLTEDYTQWKDDIRKTVNHNEYFFDFTELGINYSNKKDKFDNYIYFWEPAHYKKLLGDEMLRRMTHSRKLNNSK